MSADDNVCHTDLSSSGISLIGLTLVTVAGLLSMFADVILFGIIIYDVYVAPSKTKRRLFRTPYHVWILFLIVFDFIQGFGTSLNIKWLAREAVFCSGFCTVQGSISLIGEAGSAMLTLTITVYTYINIIRRQSMKRLGWAWAIAGFIALYTILFATIGGAIHHKGDDSFEVPDPYWCWVGSKYDKERIPSEYLWLWLAAMASFIYIPLWLFIRSSDPELWKLVLYPIAYTILVLPVSVVRWLFFGGHDPTPLTQLLVGALYQLTGFVNVILLVYIRQTTTLFRDEDGDDKNSQDRSLPSIHAPLELNDHIREVLPVNTSRAELPD